MRRFRRQSRPDTSIAPSPTTEDDPGWLTDGVKQALNCTYEDFRGEHYDECVKGPSSIYKNPRTNEDDTGYVMYDTRTLYARLEN